VVTHSLLVSLCTVQMVLINANQSIVLFSNGLRLMFMCYMEGILGHESRWTYTAHFFPNTDSDECKRATAGGSS